MNFGFGPMIKQLNNLIIKKTYSLLDNPEYTNMSYANLQVVELLYTSTDDVTQKDIESALKINRATTSKMLKLMEEKGYVERSGSKEDSRKKIVFLTEKGKKYYLDNAKVIEYLDNYLSSILTDSENEIWNNIYKKMVAALSD